MGRTKDQSLAERDRRICLYRRNGFTLTEIATLEGISRPRVSQIIAEAHAELPEDETRAEIASLLEFAERKTVELINDPGFVLGPNGRLATDDEGEPVPNKQLINESVKTLVLIAEKRARLYAADRPQKHTMAVDDAQQRARETFAAIAAKREAELRELEEARAAARPPVVPGEIIRELPAAEG